MTAPKPRLATPDDMPACAQIVNDWIDTTPWMRRSVPPAVINAALAQALDNRIIWVIGAPATAYLSLDPLTNHIGALYCRHTGQAQGAALMNAAKQGRKALSLNTHLANHRAQRFYQREGFAPISTHAPVPPETLRELRMEWRSPL